MIVLALASLNLPAVVLPVLLYIGPDVLLPLTSALAAIAGFLLLFWQRVSALAGRLWRMIRR